MICSEEKVKKTRGLYADIGYAIGCLVDKKQAQYGDSFGRSGLVLRILYPDGIRPDQYDGLLAVTRIVDKLFRIATGHPGDAENPFEDIAGYGILGTRNYKKHKNPLEGKYHDNESLHPLPEEEE